MMQVAIDALRLHADAQRVPMASSDDLRALRASLEEHGQQDPIDATSEGVILDGRTRWTLLRDLGAQTVTVRTVDLPTEQQTAYIVDRALARRHLTAEQKRALNALLREQVVEVAVHPTTKETVRIGRTVGQRAATLGVGVMTVRGWDEADADVQNRIPAPDAPTHVRLSDGRINPARHPQRKPARVEPSDRASRAVERPEPLRKSRPIPGWSRHFSTWLRRQSRPEDRDFLRRLDRELHAALEQNGVRCMKEEGES